jgi:hypothetical protein
VPLLRIKIPTAFDELLLLKVVTRIRASIEALAYAAVPAFEMALATGLE